MELNTLRVDSLDVLHRVQKNSQFLFQRNIELKSQFKAKEDSLVGLLTDSVQNLVQHKALTNRVYKDKDMLLRENGDLLKRLRKQSIEEAHRLQDDKRRKKARLFRSLKMASSSSPMSRSVLLFVSDKEPLRKTQTVQSGDTTFSIQKSNNNNNKQDQSQRRRSRNEEELPTLAEEQNNNNNSQDEGEEEVEEFTIPHKPRNTKSTTGRKRISLQREKPATHVTPGSQFKQVYTPRSRKSSSGNQQQHSSRRPPQHDERRLQQKLGSSQRLQHLLKTTTRPKQGHAAKSPGIFIL
jgi:hypothetical protein